MNSKLETRKAKIHPPPGPASGLPNPFPAWVKGAGVFAPAGAVDLARTATGCRQLEEWGLRVVSPVPSPQAPPSPAHRPPSRFFSADDDTRLAVLHALLREPQADVLLPLRGGYGCARLLDQLDHQLVRRANKPLVGYSDITALHLAFYACGVRNGLSGPMPGVEFARALAAPPPGPEALLNRNSSAKLVRQRSQNETMLAEQFVLMGRQDLAFTLHSFTEAWTPRKSVLLPPGTQLQVLKPGRAKAPVIPVNLTVLLSLAGTRHLPDLAGTILVVEDVNEPAHAIDRDLNQLRQLGILERLAGLIYGRFTKADDAQWIPEILAEYATHVPGPVIAGFPYGHAMPLVTVPVGRDASLEATAKGGVKLGW